MLLLELERATEAVYAVMVADAEALCPGSTPAPKSLENARRYARAALSVAD